MDQIYPDVGLVLMLKKIATPNVIIGLFRNNLVPTLATVLADFTPASWSGYADQVVPVADYTLSGVVAHVGGIQALPISFLDAAGGMDIYGYYVIADDGVTLIATARFDGAPVVSSPTVPILVTPILGGFSALSS